MWIHHTGQNANPPAFEARNPCCPPWHDPATLGMWATVPQAGAGVRSGDYSWFVHTALLQQPLPSASIVLVATSV